MKYQLFQDVFLLRDIPERGLKSGDIATIVEHHPGQDQEDGYSLEVFNGLGETIAVLTLEESALASLKANTVFNVRFLADSFYPQQQPAYAQQ